tara:strand:+ start:5399 stop:6367 length:969 start_codon:yes stop_codon:yes gene_type:complete
MDNCTIEELCQHIKAYEYFVIDEKVFYIYQDQFEAIEDQSIFLLKNPEEDKNLSKIEEAAQFFTQNGIKRTDRLIAIGGGATSDFAGFLASIMLRGIEWTCIPTTVLSIVDASIGGKTAVNLNNGKNLIGSFYPPSERVVCSDFLATLPDSEQISGYCEILKYAFLDKGICDYILGGFEQDHLFKMCSTYKQKLVDEDLEDRGVRKLLNLGHTIGHAIEKATSLKHGEAVAMGIEIKLKLFSPHLLDKLEELKTKLRISFAWPEAISKSDFEKFILKDKKRESEDLDFIHTANIGDVELKSIKAEELFEKLYREENYGSLFK